MLRCLSVTIDLRVIIMAAEKLQSSTLIMQVVFFIVEFKIQVG